MVRPVVERGAGIRFVPLLLALPLFIALLMAPATATAEAEKNSGSDLRTADDEFSRQLGELKRTFTELGKKFDDSAQTIERLKDAGVDSMPGGGAEIFSDRVRRIICDHKITGEQWLDAALARIIIDQWLNLRRPSAI